MLPLSLHVNTRNAQFKLLGSVCLRMLHIYKWRADRATDFDLRSWILKAFPMAACHLKSFNDEE